MRILLVEDEAEMAAALSQALKDELHAGVRCLVKGSRGSAMDTIVKALLAQGEESPHVV